MGKTVTERGAGLTCHWPFYSHSPNIHRILYMTSWFTLRNMYLGLFHSSWQRHRAPQNLRICDVNEVTGKALKVRAACQENQRGERKLELSVLCPWPPRRERGWSWVLSQWPMSSSILPSKTSPTNPKEWVQRVPGQWTGAGSVGAATLHRALKHWAPSYPLCPIPFWHLLFLHSIFLKNNW